MPGSLVYTGQQHLEEVTLEVIRFNEDHFEQESVAIDQLNKVCKDNFICWLNIEGLHDIEIIKKLGETFKIHNLALEDILNVSQRPAIDEYDDHLFLVCKMFSTKEKAIITEQFSMIVAENLIITFQEKPGDIFDGLRQRIQHPKGRIRSRNSDYLAFALLDVIVDHYMAIIEEYGEEVNIMEAELLDSFSKDMLNDLHLIKKEVNHLRRYARPLKDVIMSYMKSETPLLHKSTVPFLKDLNDHILQVTENIEVYRETINDNLNSYHTHITNKLNDVLKTLTIFSVIFIPLTFIAGVYGMNFEYIPELQYEHAYPILWALFLVIVIGMLFFFKRKKWL